MATAYEYMGNLNKSLQLNRESLAIKDKMLGNTTNQEMVDLLTKIANIETAFGYIECANKNFEWAQDILTKLYGTGSI